MAITFLWIGILILREPQNWGLYLQPWATNLLPIPLKGAMVGTALLDIFIGVLLLVDVLTWLAALLGAAHLVIILAVSGITPITIRDIGLFAATVALAISAWPKELRFWRKTNK